MARALAVECFELTSAYDWNQIWNFQLPVPFCCYRLVLVLNRRGEFCHSDEQSSFQENLPISSDVRPFSNLKASLIIFYVNWNEAAVALDRDFLTFSKETYNHSYNFTYDLSMDKKQAVKVLQQYVL